MKYYLTCEIIIYDIEHTNLDEIKFALNGNFKN